jgi:cytochrome c oxidase subunit 1
VLIFLYNIVVSWKRGEVAGDDPWGGNTLEWATTSPPPPYNFERVPAVRSYMPLRDLRRERALRQQETSETAEAPPAQGSN